MESRIIRFDDVRPFVPTEGVSRRPRFGQLGMHSAHGGPRGAVVLDIFAPVRKDYLERWQAKA